MLLRSRKRFVGQIPGKFKKLFDNADGLFTIPDDLLVSLYLSCNVSGAYDDPGAFYIGGLTYYHTGFVLAVHYGNTCEKVAETTVDITDGNKYPTKRKISDVEMEAINIVKNDFLGKWNYKIMPRETKKLTTILKWV